MTTIRPVVEDDLDALFALEVAPGQRGHVAPNPITLAEMAYKSGAYVFAIEDEDEIVGLMGLLDFREHDDLLESDDPDAAFLMRMMIGQDHQRRGHGRAAMQQAIKWAKARGNSQFLTSIVPGNVAARAFYEALGLSLTGQVVEDELEMGMRF